jgi:hypothetical protein
MNSSPSIEEAIRATVPGSKWYYLKGREWREVTVERVTKTVVILTGGIRISKRSRWAEDKTWFPPTPEMVELYEAQQMQAAAQTLYQAALEKLQAAARKATPTQLRHLVTQMENVIDLSGIKP